MEQLGPIIAAAAICCVLGAAIGSGKGQGGAGAVLGLLLGPLGILIVLVVMKPTIEVQAQRAEAVEAARANLRAQQEAGTAPPTSKPGGDAWGDRPAKRR